jgi:hypothetical protein
MSDPTGLTVHLYGKLRRFCTEQRPDAVSELALPLQDGDTIGSILQRLGVPLEEVGSNVFLNWHYSALERPVHPGDRLAVFPDDMQLLYKWYFEKERG